MLDEKTKNLQDTSNAQDTPEARAARGRANLKMFSSDYQPERHISAKSGGALFRWAGQLDAPEKVMEKFKEMFPTVRKNLTLEELRHISLYMEAIKGDVMANREINDRLWGKAIQPLEHSGRIDTNHEATPEEIEKYKTDILKRLGIENNV